MSSHGRMQPDGPMQPAPGDTFRRLAEVAPAGTVVAPNVWTRLDTDPPTEILHTVPRNLVISVIDGEVVALVATDEPPVELETRPAVEP